jgi:hypothetical protein
MFIAMDEWIEVINYEGDVGELRKYGLGKGEASPFSCPEHPVPFSETLVPPRSFMLFQPRFI